MDRFSLTINHDPSHNFTGQGDNIVLNIDSRGINFPQPFTHKFLKLREYCTIFSF